MIKNPTPSQYVMISFVAALVTIPTIYGVIWLVSVTNRPKSIPVVESLRCDAPANVDTTGWIEIPATPLARLRVPRTTRMNTVYRSADGPTHWSDPDGSFSLVIVSARRSDPRWPQIRGRVAVPGDSGRVPDCIEESFVGHQSRLETGRLSSSGNEAIYEVYSQVDTRADRVIRLTVHANSVQSQRVGLAIVRSLRFVTAPPPT
jgi:hypothetical protein